MSNFQRRPAARGFAPELPSLPLIPPEIRANLANAMAQIPRVTINVRPVRKSASLPEVGSFG